MTQEARLVSRQGLGKSLLVGGAKVTSFCSGSSTTWGHDVTEFQFALDG